MAWHSPEWTFQSCFPTIPNMPGFRLMDPVISASNGRVLPRRRHLKTFLFKLRIVRIFFQGEHTIRKKRRSSSSVRATKNRSLDSFFCHAMARQRHYTLSFADRQKLHHRCLAACHAPHAQALKIVRESGVQPVQVMTLCIPFLSESNLKPSCYDGLVCRFTLPPATGRACTK